VVEVESTCAMRRLRNSFEKACSDILKYSGCLVYGYFDLSAFIFEKKLKNYMTEQKVKAIVVELLGNNQ